VRELLQAITDPFKYLEPAAVIEGGRESCKPF